MDADKFLGRLRVLAVDDDRVCLKILEMQLRHCKYNVTAVAHAETALEMLRARKDGERFDLVISDVHMPDMDGFKLLELVGLEMDIPVIMLSANEEMETMMKGIKHGACDYLLKPVHLNRLKNIWLHVVKRSKNDPRNLISGTDNDAEQEQQSRGAEGEKRGADETDKCSRKNKKDGDGPEKNTRSSTQKKQRVQWSGALHSKFIEVVSQIGIDRAVPKKIWELMNVDCISRENVASHLQKYRLGLKRLRLGTREQSGPFPAETESWKGDWNYINMNGLDSCFPSAPGMHRSLQPHQSVQPMSSLRNSAIPFTGPAGHSGHLLNTAVQNVSNLTSSGNSYGNGDPFFASPSDGYIETAPNCMALDASRSLPYAIPGNSFANISNGTQPLDAGLCNLSNAWNPAVFPGRGHSVGIPVAPPHGGGLVVNHLSRRAAASSGPMAATGDRFHNQQMDAVRCTSAPVQGFSEQQVMPFNLGSNATSTSVPNDNPALASAPCVGSALPDLQVDDYDMLTQMLNGAGGSAVLPEQDRTLDQQAVGDLVGTSEAQNQMIGDLDDLVADWLNRDSQNLDAALEWDWQ